MSRGPVDPVAEGGSSGIVGIDALAQKYVPMTIAATTVMNAETAGGPAEKPRRTRGGGGGGGGGWGARGGGVGGVGGLRGGLGAPPLPRARGRPGGRGKGGGAA